MESQVKKQILKYLRDCITEDSKEELSIDIESKDIDKISTIKIFFPDRNSNSDPKEDFLVHENDVNAYFEVLKKNAVVGRGKEASGLKLSNIDTLDNDIKENFYKQSLLSFKKIETTYSFLDYIKYDDNTIRNKAIRIINNYIFYTNSDKDYLDGSDLEKLFFSGDNNDDIEKIEFFGNGDFIDFYDKNKNEKIYLCLENIITERNKKLIFQPLYFVELDIQEDTKEHFFTLSLAETNVSFNFYVEYYGKRLFTLENKQEKEEGFELEKDIEGLSNFGSKIDLYKSKVSKNFDIKNIAKNICLISANDIAFIKGLLKEYYELIENKNLANTKNTGLGFFFGETNIAKNHIDKLTNFTLLNNEQKDAVQNSLENNLSVIVGPPGTGKSQVVVNIMLNAYINDKTVLFASKNNTAVDTVLEKVSKLKLSYYPFLRLGSKKSQDEWSPKIMSGLRKNNTANHIAYNSISTVIEKLNNLENTLSDIEYKYLDYYQSYEDLEINLNKYDESFKNYLYSQDVIDIDFETFKNILAKYKKSSSYYNDTKNVFKKHNDEINRFLEEHILLGKLYKRIKANEINREEFSEICKNITEVYSEIEKSKKSFQEESNTLSIEISKNDHEKLLKNISKELVGIFLGENFINYENFSVGELKIILSDINEAQESVFFKKLFNLHKRDFKRARSKYFSIINHIGDESLQDYFFDVGDNLTENNDIVLKIKEIIALRKYEEVFNSNKKYTKELQKVSRDFKINEEKSYKEYQENIDRLNKVTQLECSNFNMTELEELFKKGEELFMLQETYLEIEKKLEDSMKSLSLLSISTLDFLNNEISKDVSNYFISGINKENLELYIEKIYSIFELEKIGELKRIISYKFKVLNETSQDATNINTQISEAQKTLESVSLDYLSGMISDNINSGKDKIIQSVNEIFEEGTKDYSKKFSKEVKNTYLISEFKKIIYGIKIFITTNLATKSLPLEESFFDYLIVDEASQNDIASIIPLLYRVKNVIVIGDPNQLENIVKLNDDQKIEDIFQSTFKKENLIPSKEIIEKIKSTYSYKNSVFKSFTAIYNSQAIQGPIQLKGHYRCNSDIIKYSNFIIGDYDLFPKNSIEKKYISDVGIDLGIHWVGDIRTENIAETKRNEKEAEAIIEYLKQMISALGDRLSEVSIGVIAPFRNQVSYIQELIRSNGLEKYDNILVDTVHKFQGDEKDIILFSTVYPNAKASKFLDNKNLLNVAVSRARSSFLIFGDKQAIKSYRSDKGEELLYTSLIHYIDALEKGKELLEYKKYATKFEKDFFQELEKAGIVFDYQYPIYGGRYNLDFSIKLKGANNYINIELDGGVHNKQKSYDYTRNTKVESLGYKVIRYSNTYMMRNMGEIIEGLKKICEIKH